MHYRCTGGVLRRGKKIQFANSSFCSQRTMQTAQSKLHTYLYSAWCGRWGRVGGAWWKLGEVGASWGGGRFSGSLWLLSVIRGPDPGPAAFWGVDSDAVLRYSTNTQGRLVSVSEECSGSHIGINSIALIFVVNCLSKRTSLLNKTN